MKTIKISLLASGIGTAAWFSGVHRLMWPQHPQIAIFLVTVAATCLVTYLLRESPE